MKLLFSPRVAAGLLFFCTLTGCGTASHHITCASTAATCALERFVFATTDANQVLLFPIEQNGALRAPNPLQPAPAAPAGIAISAPERELFVADHVGETLYAYVPSSNSYTSAPGSPYSLGSGAGMLESVTATTDGKFVYVLGLSGGIFGFSISSNGQLTAIPGSPFAAPTQTVASVADTSNKLLFVLTASSISVFSIDATTGALTLSVPSFPLPSTNLPTVGMAATVPGNFLYVALSSANAIAAFSFNPSTGALTQVSGSPFPSGKGPFTLTATANAVYVANTQDQTISAFSWDSTTGALTQISGSPFAAPSVGGMLTTLDGQWLYVPSVQHVSSPQVNAILGFSIGSSGTLTPLPGSPFNAKVSLSGGLVVF